MAVLGPALIVVAVLLVLRHFAFRDLITTQQSDILAQWLPFYCFLGKTVAAGHVPVWNPFAMAGVPFASDPQSGWMYLPAMALFAAAPCHVAIRWFIVLQPMIAGLGAYWFLRMERLSGPSATAGGLVLALLMAESHLALELPFAGTIAWTTILLAGASGYLRASRWSSRLLWLALAALGWGQVAAAHLSHGLVVATLGLAIYAAVRLWSKVRTDHTPLALAASLAALLILALPAVNLAYLWPRLAYLPLTTLALGYRQLRALPGLPAVGRVRANALTGNAAVWPLTFAAPVGAYIGGAAAALSLAGWWSVQHRRLVGALSLFGAICYVLSLHWTAQHLASHIERIRFADFYLHAPERFQYGTVLAIPLLAAIGLEAWREAQRWPTRIAMLIPGLVFWGALPVALRSEHAYPVAFVIGIALAGAALALSALRPRLLWLVTAVMALELCAHGLALSGFAAAPKPGDARAAFTPILAPTVSSSVYTSAGPIARALAGEDARYWSKTPTGMNLRGRAYLIQHPPAWGFQADQRSMLFGLQDVSGYNPIQLIRYWRFVRAVNRGGLSYNSAFFVDPPPVALNLLHIGLVTSPAGSVPPEPAAWLVAREGAAYLWRLPGNPPRATIATSWTVVSSPREALRSVLAPGFDPDRAVVLEASPAVASLQSPSGMSGGTAVYHSSGLSSARIDVDSPGAAVVVIRIPFAPGWTAAVDGNPATVLPADSLIQAVPVSAGRHVVILSYRDPSIRYGLLGSTVSLLIIGIAVVFARTRE